MRKVMVGLVTLVALVVIGCQPNGTSWNPRRPRPTVRNEMLIAFGDARRLGYAVSWPVDLGLSKGNQIAYPAWLGNRLVVIETPANIVTAIDTRDGTWKWSTMIGKRSDRVYKATRIEDRIYVNTESRLYELSVKGGKILIDSPLQTVAVSSPAIIGSRAVFGGVTGVVFGHQLAAGHAGWSYRMPAGIVVSPVPVGENAVVVDEGGTYAMISARRGKVIWKKRAYRGIVAEPAVGANMIYIASTDQKLYARQRDGTLRWAYSAEKPLTESPVRLGNTLYLPVPGAGLRALDAQDGEELWRLETDATPVMLSDRGLLLLNAKTQLIWVNPQNGRVELTVPLSEPVDWVMPGADEQLILISKTGRVQHLLRVK